MEFPLILILALATFGIVIGFALWSKWKTEERQDDPNAPTSHLAKDGPGPHAVKAANNQANGAA